MIPTYEIDEDTSEGSRATTKAARMIVQGKPWTVGFMGPQQELTVEEDEYGNIIGCGSEQDAVTRMLTMGAPHGYRIAGPRTMTRPDGSQLYVFHMPDFCHSTEVRH